MRSRLIRVLAILFTVALLAVTLRGFLRGGQDFQVFHYAGRLAIEGRWDALYNEGPDRYLYAPVFALLIAPLAALPSSFAHGIWLLGTLAVLAGTLRVLAQSYGWFATLLAGAFTFRALAIDLRYGQVNIWILGAAVWAIFEWIRRGERARRTRLLISWFLFTIAAVTKIYPVALFLFPLWGTIRNTGEGRVVANRVLAVAWVTVSILVLLPYSFHTYPWGGLEREWFAALGRKGLPTETHNQSFLAFLVRWVGGEPFHSLRLGGQTLQAGFAQTFGTSGMRSLSFIAALFFIGIATVFVRTVIRRDERGLDAGAFALALCFLPGHLIWKSYFVLGLPMVAATFATTEKIDDPRRRRTFNIVFATVGGLLALSGLIPALPSAWIESTSPFLWAHLFVCLMGARLVWPKGISAAPKV